MSKLHFLRVRRARGLAMPLPPKPKARPLGPPTLFVFKGVSIRVRADVERAGWTWGEFLDELVTLRLDDDTFTQGAQALQIVERWVPLADIPSHREDVRRRMREAHEAEQAAAEAADAAVQAMRAEWNATVAEKGHLGAILDRLMRKPAA